MFFSPFLTRFTLFQKKFRHILIPQDAQRSSELFTETDVSNHMEESPSVRGPRHWELLSEADKGVYLRISAALSAPSCRNKRNKRIDDFKEILDAIEVFENSNQSDKWKRCLVCGVCRIPNGIAVNITQLKKLVFKCKSSINGSLKGLGYEIVVSRTSSCTELLDTIPHLRMDTTELRQWTVRMMSGFALPDSPPETVPPQPARQMDLDFGCPWKQSTSTFFDTYHFDSAAPFSSWSGF
jgi:hypothetical protein